MPLRIRRTDVDQVLTDAGHHPSEWDGDTWDPGYRVEQAGPRTVHVFHDGPAEASRLELYQLALRNTGHTTQLTRQDRGGRHRLEVTRDH